MSNPEKKEVAHSDWTGLLSIMWVFGFLAMCGWSVAIANSMVMLEKIVAVLGTPTVLVLKFYFDKTNGV